VSIRKRPRRKREQPAERLVRPEVLAELFDVEFDTVVQWAKTGKVRGLRTPGGHWRIFESEIERLIAEQLSEQMAETVEAVQA